MQLKKSLMLTLKHHTIMELPSLNGQVLSRNPQNKPHGVSDKFKYMLLNAQQIVLLAQDQKKQIAQLVFHHTFC